MTASAARVDVVIDDGWFLRLPHELVDADDETRMRWARDVVDDRAPVGAAPQAAGRELLAAVLADSFRVLAPGAIDSLRLVRGGLPGSVIVQVFAELVTLDSLDELVDEVPAALPRQTMPLEVDGARDARIVSTVRQGERGAVGFLQLQALRGEVLIEVVASSAVLEDLGLGLDALEALLRHVEVTVLADAGD